MNNESTVRSGERDTAIGAKATGAYWGKNDGPGPRIMAADTIDDNEVRNLQDEDVGDIEHVMLDVPTGRVAYAVMSVGGFLGMGEKLFAIPWSALKLDTEKKCFRLDVSKEKLSKAEGFDKDHWPTMADEKWARDLHKYYNARHYWDEILGD
jgi:hypothetical protein